MEEEVKEEEEEEGKGMVPVRQQLNINKVTSFSVWESVHPSFIPFLLIVLDSNLDVPDCNALEKVDCNVSLFFLPYLVFDKAIPRHCEANNQCHKTIKTMVTTELIIAASGNDQGPGR